MTGITNEIPLITTYRYNSSGGSIHPNSWEVTRSCAVNFAPKTTGSTDKCEHIETPASYPHPNMVFFGRGMYVGKHVILVGRHLCAQPYIESFSLCQCSWFRAASAASQEAFAAARAGEPITGAARAIAAESMCRRRTLTTDLTYSLRMPA